MNPLILITPDNQRVVAGLISNYYASAATVIFNFIGGAASITSTVKDAANAFALVNSIDNALKYFTEGTIPVSPNGVIISTCAPTTFVALAGAGPVLNLTGVFTPEIVNGFFYIEDLTGGFDSNGFKYTPTYLDSQTAQATWNSNGDSTVGSSMIYYQDANGLCSNGLFGLTTS